MLVACQKFLREYTRHEERQRVSHSWTLASPAGMVVCVKPLEPVQRQEVGEASGSTTSFPSPTHDNTQVTVKGGARLGTKTVGCTHENYCTTEQLEITDVYLYGKHGCFHFAFMLLHCLQGKATPSEDKLVSNWFKKKSYTTLQKALTCLCIASHLPCKYAFS